MEIDTSRRINSMVTAQSSQYQAKNSDTAASNASSSAASQSKAADVDHTPGKIAGNRNDKSEENPNKELEAQASDNMLKMAVDTANKELSGSQRKLQCSVHEDTQRMMVKVIDTKTDKVIREIPPEKTLDLFAKVLEKAGLLIDEKK